MSGNAEEEEDDTWQDITALVRAGASTLGSGELIKLPSLTLLDAMTSIQVMDARLDMGMLTPSDQASISQWDIERRLTLPETLWIVERMFCCEMTWHHSASLLQTIYTCNYYTTGSIPSSSRGDNKGRDLVLYPILVATGKCCRFVWNEYSRENVFAEEDVQLGAAVVSFFDEYALPDVARLLDSAQAFLEEEVECKGGDQAAELLLGHVTMRRHWLAVLSGLAVERLADDPGSLADSMRSLSTLGTLHSKHVEAISSSISSSSSKPMAASEEVAGV
ncbi:N-alpha-acetyltransferase, non-catalitic subunit, partial [Coemansia aciculifera]